MRLVARLGPLTGLEVQWKDEDPLLGGHVPIEVRRMMHPYCEAIKGRGPEPRKRCVACCGYINQRATFRATEANQVRRVVCHAGVVVWQVSVSHNDVLLGTLLIGPAQEGGRLPGVPGVPPAIMEAAELAIEAIIKLMPERDIECLDAQNRALHPALRRFLRFLQAGVRHDHDVAAMAWHSQVSASRLYHLCRVTFDDTPGGMRDRVLLRRVQEMLVDGEQTIGQVAEALGFSDQRYFATWFRRLTGRSPSVWRAEQRELDPV